VRSVSVDRLAEPVSIDRLGRALGRVPAGVMAQLDTALGLHLGL